MSYKKVCALAVATAITLGSMNIVSEAANRTDKDFFLSEFSELQYKK